MKSLFGASLFFAGLVPAVATAANFGSGDGPTAKFGVHEIILSGDGAVANPFDTQAKVTFTPPSGAGNAKTVFAFYDGGNIWRARVYAGESGDWQWQSVCATDKGLDGKRGTFRVADSQLRGRLLIHPKNPRQWMTENGQWFLNLNDTAYFLLGTHDNTGKPIAHEDFENYVRDAVEHGITSFRSWSATGSKPRISHQEGKQAYTNTVFGDEDCTRMHLENFQKTDERLQWLLNNYPDIYMQFIILPLATNYGTDEKFWPTLSAAQKERLLRYLVARFAAYPQIFWLIENDAHYGEKFPHSNALAREVGTYFHQNDPWQHPLSTGPARHREFDFAGEEWATYIHLENAFEFGAKEYVKYEKFAKPVFLGEDRYEQDHPDRDPVNMNYFQRRLFWSWLLAGGSTNYGGRWWLVQPYAQTGKRPAPSIWPNEKVTFTKPLNGLDAVRFIRDYFPSRKIELSDFAPAHNLAADLDGGVDARAPKVMRRGNEEFLIYHPNAAADGRETKPDDKAARLRLDLRNAPGKFAVEWFRADDGTTQTGTAVEGGKTVEFNAPWPGTDVVLRLIRN